MKSLISSRFFYQFYLAGVVIFLLIHSSCKKEAVDKIPPNNHEELPKYDPRDSVVGNYEGYSILTWWSQNTGFVHDTSTAVITISKRYVPISQTTDNPIDTFPQLSISIQPGCGCVSNYYLDGGNIVPIAACMGCTYSFTFNNDNLHFYHRHGKGPLWRNYNTKKVK